MQAPSPAGLAAHVGLSHMARSPTMRHTMSGRGDAPAGKDDAMLPPPPGLRCAMSLVEVMIALTVMAVAIAGALGLVVNSDAARRNTRDNVMAHAIERALLERFAAAASEDLNTTAAAWSLCRVRDENGNGNEDDDANWLTDDPTVAASVDPVQLRRVLQTVPGKPTLGLIDAPTGLDRFRVWIEYFRGVTALDDKGQPIPGRTGGVFEDNQFLPAYRLPADRSLAEMVEAQDIGPNDVICIRIIMTWLGRSGGTRTFTITTGRKP